MLKIQVDEPVILARHEGRLEPLEATHHYCRIGWTPNGTILSTYSMHPDVRMPEGVFVREDAANSSYPVFRFHPRVYYPDYRWPDLCAFQRSEDGGRTWSKPAAGPGCSGAAPVGDRTICPAGHVWTAKPGLGVTFFLESADNGYTWKDRPGILFHYPRELELVASTAVYPGVEVVMYFENCGTFKTLADGSLVTFTTVLISRSGKAWHMPLMFRSTDGGFNFEFIGFPTGWAPPVNHEGFDEPGLAELPNGDLLAAFRTEYHQPDRVLMQSRSSDGGRTWTEPIICPGVPRYYPLRILHPIRNEGKICMNAANVSPWLTVLPNGVAAMVYGRPGQCITFSEDGSGQEWRDRIPIVPEPSLFGINSDSSHMAGVVAVGANELVIVYDMYNYRNPLDGKEGNTVFALRMTVDRT